VMFSDHNVDEEQRHSQPGKSRLNPQSEEFATYLSQQINGSNDGQFLSPASSDGSDDEDDFKWFNEAARGFPTTNQARGSRRILLAILVLTARCGRRH